MPQARPCRLTMSAVSASCTALGCGEGRDVPLAATPAAVNPKSAREAPPRWSLFRVPLLEHHEGAAGLSQRAHSAEAGPHVLTARVIGYWPSAKQYSFRP